MNSTTSADVRMHPRSHTPNPGPRLPRHPSRPSTDAGQRPASEMSEEELQDYVQRAAWLLENRRIQSDYLEGFRDGALLGALATALVVLGGIATGLSLGWL